APKPPGRSDVTKRLRPSDDRYEGPSFEGLFTTGPRFTGVDQLSDTVWRVDAQRSAPPSVPGRFEKKMISRPSKRIVGRRSACGLLSSETSVAGPKDP